MSSTNTQAALARMGSRFLSPLFAVLALLSGVCCNGQESLPPPVTQLQRLALALRKIPTQARVLYVTAHPDDEDSATISWLTHGQGAELTLFTLTRGEGGQNRIGRELGPQLGVLRMEELRAARLRDGARQLLGSVRDFGYSFSEKETFELWGRRQTLDEMIAVIRRLKPHVLLTMPAHWAGGGRHHQASAQLAQEAAEVAGKRVRPELGPPHVVARVFEQVWTSAGQDASRLVRVPVFEGDPVLGGSYAEMGLWARAQHKCQTMRQLAPTAPAPARNLWRLVAGAALGKPAGLLAGLELKDPQVPLPAAFTGWRDLNPARPDETRALTMAALRKMWAAKASSRSCERLLRAWSLGLQLHVDVTAPKAETYLGDSWPLSFHLHNRGNARLSLRATVLGLGTGEGLRFFEGILSPGERKVGSLPVQVASEKLSGVRLERGTPSGRYRGPPKALPDLSCADILIEARIEGRGWVTVRHIPLSHRQEDSRFPRQSILGLRQLPRIEARFDAPVILSALGIKRPAIIRARLRVRGDVSGDVRLVQVLPSGGEVVLAEHSLKPGERAFTLEAAAEARVAGESRLALYRYPPVPSIGQQRRVIWSVETIDYPHIQRSSFIEPASAKLVVLPLKLPPPDRLIGYLPATADRSLPLLRSLPLHVHELSSRELVEADFSAYRVIVLGVRAYGTREDVRRAHPALMRWVRAGGHLILQYERPRSFNGSGASSPWTPYPGRVGVGRATDEAGKVVVKAPGHPFFSAPNLISPADFSHWTQDRAVYLFEPADEHFEDLLLVEDPFAANSGPKGGALVTARVGRGRWTYTGLAFFRQLPAGVPGAWRLFLNLLSAH